MESDDLAFYSAGDLVGLLSTKQVSPVELTTLYFDRIDRIDSQLHSYLFISHDDAIRSAKTAEAALMRGDCVGPLHGLPIAIKDTQMTKDIPTTMGSLVFKDRVPQADSAVVERIKKSGAIILGKTNVPEFGLVGTCENRFGYPGGNPWDTTRTPGGSSGGSAAAVAAFLCPIATGSDGGGSIRIPANFCGIYGIKPTQGRVSAFSGTHGTPMPNMFSQSGPLSRTVRDAALLLNVLSGYDARDPISLRTTPPDFVQAVGRDISKIRIAWSPDFGFAKVEPEVVKVTSAAARAFEDFGCVVEETDLVLQPPYDTYGSIITADFHTAYSDYWAEHANLMTDFTNFFFEKGARVTAADYALALGQIDVLRSQMDDLFETYDLLLSPTACFSAFKNGDFPGPMTGQSEFPDLYWNGSFTMPINLIGHPAATAPAGFSHDGLPIGLHIVGRKGDESTVLAASAAFERAMPWSNKRPAIS